MIRALALIGLLAAGGIGVYLIAVNNQIADIEALCSRFTEGTDVGDLREIENSYSVKLMGIFEVKDKPRTQQALFCAVLTMCDTSCWVEFQDNKVVRAGLSAL